MRAGHWLLEPLPVSCGASAMSVTGMFWKPGARLGCEVSAALFHHHSGVCATVRQLFHRGRHGCVRAFWQDKFAVQGVDGRCMV